MLTIDLKDKSRVRYCGSYDYQIKDGVLTINANGSTRVFEKGQVENATELVPTTRTHVNNPITLKGLL